MNLAWVVYMHACKVCTLSCTLEATAHCALVFQHVITGILVFCSEQPYNLLMLGTRLESP